MRFYANFSAYRMENSSIIIIRKVNRLMTCIRLTGALEFSSQFVGSLVTVLFAVAQPGKLVQLQHRRRLVHLTSEVSVFQVQKEYLSFNSVSDSSLSVHLSWGRKKQTIFMKLYNCLYRGDFFFILV